MPPLPTGKSPQGDPDRRLPCRRLPQRHLLKGSLKAFPSGIPIGISLRNPSGPGLGSVIRASTKPDVNTTGANEGKRQQEASVNETQREGCQREVNKYELNERAVNETLNERCQRGSLLMSTTTSILVDVNEITSTSPQRDPC